MVGTKRTEAERYERFEAHRRGMGERLRAARARQGVSQKQAAEDTGISAAALSAYESGQKSMPFQVAVALCVYYKLSAADLAGVKGV